MKWITLALNAAVIVANVLLIIAILKDRKEEEK